MRQYPNQRQSFTANISRTPVTSAIAGLNILFFLGVLVTGGAGTQNLLDWGAKYGPYIAEGQYWRLFLPMFLHVGFFHLLTNLFGLVIFGSMVEQIFKSRNFLIVYLLAGVMGNVASYLAGPLPGVGASGSVFGIFGAFGVYLLLNRRALGQQGRQQLTSIGLIIAINIVLGLTTSGIDNAAHMGGLLAGGLVAYLIAPRERLFTVETPFNFGPPRLAMRTGPQPESRVILAVTLILIIAVVVTWYVSGTYETNIIGRKVPG